MCYPCPRSIHSPREREYYVRLRPKCCSGLLKRLCHRQECCGMLRGHSSEHLETYALLSKANINGSAQGSLPFTNWPVQGSLRFPPALSPGGRFTNVSLRVDLPFDPSTGSGQAGSGRTNQAIIRTCRVLREVCCAKPAFPRRPSHKCNAPCRLALRPFDKLRANGFDRLWANETGNSPFVPSAARSLLRETCFPQEAVSQMQRSV